MIFSSLFFGLSALGCTTNSNNGGGGGANVVVVPLGEFSNLPPTPAPTPPPPPPPVAFGWVPAPPRAELQTKTRQNCIKRVDFLLDVATSGATSKSVQEMFEYTCEHQVYVEVKLFNTPEPTHCSCGLSYNRQVPPVNPDYKAATTTTITQFNLVIYDIAYNRPLQIISEFDLEISPNVTEGIGADAYKALIDVVAPADANGQRPEDFAAFLDENQKLEEAGEGEGDYSMVNTGFFGYVKKIDRNNYPLLSDAEENRNNVAAMCFTVEEVYRTSYRWPEPPKPSLGAAPNAFVTNCVPLYMPWSGYDPSDAGSLPVAQTVAPGGKRWHTAADCKANCQVYWFREFLLFKNKDKSGLDVSVSPKDRYLTSYYIESNCNHEKGIITFDREFDSSIDRDNALYGAFRWTRTYVTGGQKAVGGVPKRLAPGGTYQVLGHHQVTWYELTARSYEVGSQDAGAFRPSVMAHFINGTEGVNPWAGVAGAGNAFQEDVHKFKLCKAVPQVWFDCTAPLAGAPNPDNYECPYKTTKYGETALFWNIPKGKNDLDCTGITAPAGDGGTAITLATYKSCDAETTLLSFQNFGTGAMARDFSKKSDSWLLTGPRGDFCTNSPSNGVFDTLVFQAIKEGQALKRGVVGASKRKPTLNYKRDANVISGAPEDPAFGHPEAADIITKPAAGSASSTGKPGGDHPMTLFPETYTVPVSLDPNDIEYSSAKDGWVFDGKFSPCLQGTQGCNCRDRVGRPACDAPLVCTSDVVGMQQSGFCVDPPCQPGQPGCDCVVNDDNTKTCGNSNLECNEESFSCVFKVTCTPGTAGCVCDGGPSGTCSGTASCYEGFCLAFDCPSELPGCACGTGAVPCILTNQECSGGLCADPVAGGPFTTAKKLGGRCGVDADCVGSTGAKCHPTAKVCTGDRCAVGSSGCRCNVGKCDNALDECTDMGICLTQTCEPGAGGCQCFQGTACAAGFECDKKWDGVSTTRNDRCIRQRCTPGTAGCPCDKSAAKPCNKVGFNCVNMLAVGTDYKCVAIGHQCGNQIDRCLKYCGASNVLKCPGCSFQVPVCKTMSASPATLIAAILALFAVMVQLF